MKIFRVTSAGTAETLNQIAARIVYAEQFIRGAGGESQAEGLAVLDDIRAQLARLQSGRLIKAPTAKIAEKYVIGLMGVKATLASQDELIEAGQNGETAEVAGGQTEDA